MERPPSRSDTGAADLDPLGIPRNLLRDAVFVRLLESILRGEYRRGQRLRLDTIAQDMRVSRTPVREALVPLEALRLVSVQRYVGVVIAQWSVEQMVERVRIASGLIAEPPVRGPGFADRFDAFWLRDCLSEAGAFVELGSWALRRVGSGISADWLASQRPVLDMFFTDEVARANGIDPAVGRRDRLAALKRARDAALHDDVAGCSVALVELGAGLIALPERFRARASA